MAAYTGTPVVNFWFEQGDKNGKRIRVVRNLTITLSTQGGATNTIALSSLGVKATTAFPAMVTAGLFVDGSAQNRTVWLYCDATNMYVGDPTQATDANRSIPGDVTGTLTFEIAALPL